MERIERNLSGSGHSEFKLKSLGHWNSSWGAWESDRLVDMGLICSAIRKRNLTELAFCHALSQEAIQQRHAWSYW
jgi:hypothetical protein